MILLLNIGVLGIGNAGNQIADLAFRNNMAAYAINASEKDLASVSPDLHVYILSHDGIGCGKDRDVAKAYVKSELKSLMDNTEFSQFMDKIEVVYVVASTGGGTGSGMSPILIDVLSNIYKDKLFILVGILPALVESIAAQRNTIEFLKEVQGIENLSYLLFDNERAKKLPQDQMMQKVNQEIYEALEIMRGEFNYNTPYGMIDDADILKILTVPGLINVSQVVGFQEKDLDDKSIEERYLEVLKTNATCELDKDRIIKRLGIILNLAENVKKYYDPSIATIKERIGEPLEVFEHMCVSSEVPNRVCVILSGVSIPDDRIGLIAQRIREVEEALKKVKTCTVLDNVDVKDLHLGTKVVKGSSEKADLSVADDIFGKY